jgi:cyanate permease
MEMIWAQYYGRLTLGTVRGLVYPIQMAIGAVGPLVMGLLYDTSGSYQSSWLLLAIGFGFSAIIMQFSRRPHYPGPVRRPPQL